jgi:hypothetical protein
MIKPKLMKDFSGQPVLGAQMRLDQMEEWRTAGIPALREVILRLHITGVHLPDEMIRPEARRYEPRQHEIEAVCDQALDAVRYGRLIDFGHLPNTVIQSVGRRAGQMYNRGALGHPFRDPWLMYHTWEGGACLYLFALTDRSKSTGECELCALDPMKVAGQPLLFIGDRGILWDIDQDNPEQSDARYYCSAAPSSFRYIRGLSAEKEAVVLRENLGGDPRIAAATNVLDPMVTGLMILNTRGVRQETIVADAKLQKARVKSGKSMIPPYRRIETEGYVTAILARGDRRVPGDPRGGTHASPIPHIRMGHPRTYKDGHTTFIRDTLVNVGDEMRDEFLRTRSHYTVKP